MASPAKQGPASRNDDQKTALLSAGAGKRVFVTTIAFTTSSSSTTLPTTTDSTMDNGGRPIPSNACWVFQPDADAQVALTANSPAITNTNSAWIAAGAFDQQWAESTDAKITVKGRTASGNLQVFVLV